MLRRWVRASGGMIWCISCFCAMLSGAQCDFEYSASGLYARSKSVQKTLSALINVIVSVTPRAP